VIILTCRGFSKEEPAEDILRGRFLSICVGILKKIRGSSFAGHAVE